VPRRTSLVAASFGALTSSALLFSVGVPSLAAAQGSAPPAPTLAPVPTAASAAPVSLPPPASTPPGPAVYLPPPVGSGGPPVYQPPPVAPQGSPAASPTYYPYSYTAPPPGVYGGPVAPASLPAVIESEGQAAPAGYVAERRPRGGLVLAGVGVFAPLFAFSITAAVAGRSPKDRWLFLPVLGPALDLYARRSCSSETDDRTSCQNPDTLLQFNLLGQATGAALFIAGFVAQREVFVRKDAAVARRAPFAVLPSFGADASGRPGSSPGITAIGRF
jgi:hypothetical protein